MRPAWRCGKGMPGRANSMGKGTEVGQKQRSVVGGSAEDTQPPGRPTQDGFPSRRNSCVR